MLEDGRCIFNAYFTPTAPPKNLITGMFTALQGFVMELTGKYPTILSTDDFTFYFQKRGPITIVLNTSETIKQPNQLSEIGLRFLQQFGNEVEKWKGDEAHFSRFSEELVDLLGVEQTTKRIDPEKPLSPMGLLHLDPKYQALIKELISRKQATSKELAETLQRNEYHLRLDLEELVEMGFIGRIYLVEEYHYFTQ